MLKTMTPTGVATDLSAFQQHAGCGAGWVGIRSITGDAALPDIAVQSEEAPSSGLAVINQALDELTLALADDPENRNLSHLVLMVHKTRGNLLRRNSEKLVRD